MPNNGVMSSTLKTHAVGRGDLWMTAEVRTLMISARGKLEERAVSFADVVVPAHYKTGISFDADNDALRRWSILRCCSQEKLEAQMALEDAILHM